MEASPASASAGVGGAEVGGVRRSRPGPPPSRRVGVARDLVGVGLQEVTFSEVAARASRRRRPRRRWGVGRGPSRASAVCSENAAAARSAAAAAVARARRPPAPSRSMPPSRNARAPVHSRRARSVQAAGARGTLARPWARSAGTACSRTMARSMRSSRGAKSVRKSDITPKIASPVYRLGLPRWKCADACSASWMRRKPWPARRSTAVDRVEEPTSPCPCVEQRLHVRHQVAHAVLGEVGQPVVVLVHADERGVHRAVDVVRREEAVEPRLRRGRGGSCGSTWAGAPALTRGAYPAAGSAERRLGPRHDRHNRTFQGRDDSGPSVGDGPSCTP